MVMTIKNFKLTSDYILDRETLSDPYSKTTHTHTHTHTQTHTLTKEKYR